MKGIVDIPFFVRGNMYFQHYTIVNNTTTIVFLLLVFATAILHVLFNKSFYVAPAIH
jgi:hypothetical protein